MVTIPQLQWEVVPQTAARMIVGAKPLFNTVHPQVHCFTKLIHATMSQWLFNLERGLKLAGVRG